MTRQEQTYRLSVSLVVFAAPLPPLADARLVAAVHLPSDQVVLALVEGTDEQAVAAAATAAGWRVDRLHPATWIFSGS